MDIKEHDRLRRANELDKQIRDKQKELDALKSSQATQILVGIHRGIILERELYIRVHPTSKLISVIMESLQDEVDKLKMEYANL
jgi:ribosomal protein L29